MLLAKSLGASETGRNAIELTQAHLTAVNRRRRIVVQDDPSNFDPEELYGMNFEEWIKYRFEYADQPGSEIDSIRWDLENGDQAVSTTVGWRRFVRLAALAGVSDRPCRER